MKIKTPRWTTERFKLAAGAGCFHDIKVELVGGRLVEMTESPEHRNTVENLEELLVGLLGKDHWYVSRETSVEFPDWTPLPDIAVCRGSRKPLYLRRRELRGRGSPGRSIAIHVPFRHAGQAAALRPGPRPHRLDHQPE